MTNHKVHFKCKQKSVQFPPLPFFKTFYSDTKDTKLKQDPGTGLIFPSGNLTIITIIFNWFHWYWIHMWYYYNYIFSWYRDKHRGREILLMLTFKVTDVLDRKVIGQFRYGKATSDICLMCKDGPENIAHFILDCKYLQSCRGLFEKKLHCALCVPKL